MCFVQYISWSQHVFGQVIMDVSNSRCFTHASCTWTWLAFLIHVHASSRSCYRGSCFDLVFHLTVMRQRRRPSRCWDWWAWKGSPCTTLRVIFRFHLCSFVCKFFIHILLFLSFVWFQPCLLIRTPPSFQTFRNTGWESRARKIQASKPAEQVCVYVHGNLIVLTLTTGKQEIKV